MTVWISSTWAALISAMYNCLDWNTIDLVSRLYTYQIRYESLVVYTYQIWYELTCTSCVKLMLKFMQERLWMHDGHNKMNTNRTCWCWGGIWGWVIALPADIKDPFWTGLQCLTLTKSLNKKYNHQMYNITYNLFFFFLFFRQLADDEALIVLLQALLCYSWFFHML